MTAVFRGRPHLVVATDLLEIRLCAVLPALEWTATDCGSHSERFQVLKMYTVSMNIHKIQSNKSSIWKLFIFENITPVRNTMKYGHSLTFWTIVPSIRIPHNKHISQKITWKSKNISRFCLLWRLDNKHGSLIHRKSQFWKTQNSWKLTYNPTQKSGNFANSKTNDLKSRNK